jgi:GTPase SAR1 family protein
MNRKVGVEDVPYIKIALIGDVGVGKSTLSSVLVSGYFESSPIYRYTGLGLGLGSDLELELGLEYSYESYKVPV